MEELFVAGGSRIPSPLERVASRIPSSTSSRFWWAQEQKEAGVRGSSFAERHHRRPRVTEGCHSLGFVVLPGCHPDQRPSPLPFFSMRAPAVLPLSSHSPLPGAPPLHRVVAGRNGWLPVGTAQPAVVRRAVTRRISCAPSQPPVLSILAGAILSYDRKEIVQS